MLIANYKLTLSYTINRCTVPRITREVASVRFRCRGALPARTCRADTKVLVSVPPLTIVHEVNRQVDEDAALPRPHRQTERDMKPLVRADCGVWHPARHHRGGHREAHCWGR